jgi:hypothetical protein
MAEVRDSYVAKWRDECVKETLTRATEKTDAKHGKPHNLGRFWTDGIITPQPPIACGLELVVDAGRSAGNEARRTFGASPDQRPYGDGW